MKIRSLTIGYYIIAVVAMTLAIFPATGAWAGNKVFDLVSLGNDGSLPESHYNGDHSKITPDGRYVVFRSGELKLVTPNTSGNQIFLRDRELGTTELISTNDQGQYGNNSSDWATLSNDGCRVVFQSYASNLVPNDNNGLPDIFLRDRCVSPMTTTRVNLNYNGAESPAASYTPAISGNGKFVAFNSYSTDLIVGVTRSDLLYLRDLDQQTTILLSESIVDGLGEQAWNPSLSYDGSRIAFTSASKELVNGVLAMWNVFLYDANSSPHIRLVSADANGSPQDFANGDQPLPGISDDGHYVSFYSNAHNLVPNDTNNKYDVFVKNVDTKEIWRATESSDGAESNDDTQFNSTLSKDGTWVTFWASASNLISNSTISRLVVLHNIHTGETRRILGTNPELAPKISGDLYGRFISDYWGEQLDARYASSGVFVYDRHYLPVAMANIDSTTKQPVKVGDSVRLDGSSSNNNANVNSTNNFFAPKPTPALSYTWTQTEGNAVTFDNPHDAKPSFTVPAEGTYKFNLVVNDTVEDSLPDTLTIQVGAVAVTPNQKPIADAGPDQTDVPVGNNVLLDGSLSSDPDNGPSPLVYSWTQISGLSLTLTDSHTATPGFTPTMAGSYSFRLVVNDGKDSSAADIVTIVVVDGNPSTPPSNIPPIAAAGDDQNAIVSKTTPVSLDGSHSYDPDSSTPLSYQWTQIAGPAVKIYNPKTASPSFIPGKIGSYSFQLVVNDSEPAASLPSFVTVTVSTVNTGNQPPLASPQVVAGNALIGSVVKLTGAGSSDPDGPKKLQYQWSQNDGPGKIILTGPKTVSPSFTPKLPGFYVFNLAVFDGLNWSTPESVTVYVEGAITVGPPVADDIWNLGTSQFVGFATSGINPKIALKSYVVLYNASKNGWDIHALANKPKATASGAFLARIPKSASWLTDYGLVFICANDEFCGYSDIFSIKK